MCVYTGVCNSRMHCCMYVYISMCVYKYVCESVCTYVTAPVVHPKPETQRLLTLVAKTIQSMANMSLFGPKCVTHVPQHYSAIKYMHTHTCTHTRAHTHTYARTHARTRSRSQHNTPRTYTKFCRCKYTHVTIHVTRVFAARAAQAYRHTGIHTHVDIHTYTYTHIHAHIHIHTYTYTHIHTYIHKRTHTHTLTHIHTRTRTYTNRYTHTHRYTHRYTHTYTHACIQRAVYDSNE